MLTKLLEGLEPDPNQGFFSLAAGDSDEEAAGAFDEEKCVAICEALLKRMDEVQNVEISDMGLTEFEMVKKGDDVVAAVVKRRSVVGCQVLLYYLHGRL